MSRHDDDHIAAYLLGELGDGDAETFEDELVADDALAERTRAVHAELYDDYAAGDLIGVRQQAFEERFLSTPAGRERLAFAELLRDAAARAPATAPAGTWQRLRGWLTGPRTAMVAGLACAAALFLVFYARPAGEGSELDPVAELELEPSALRAAGDTPVLPRAARVRVVLELGPEDDYPSYELRFGDRSLAVERAGDRLVVTLVRGALAPGRHQLELVGVGDDGRAEPLAYYELVVPED